MIASPLLQGLGGLLNLSRREGVDVRPTLLRVLTDLYVQAAAHTADEEAQFTELATRLIDSVDDATRAAVRAKLSIYPHTPRAVLQMLGIEPEVIELVDTEAPAETAAFDDDFEIVDDAMPEAMSVDIGTVETAVVETAETTATAAPEATLHHMPSLSMQPADAAALQDMFDKASSRERAAMLRNLEIAPLKPSVRVDPRRAARAVTSLEHYAMAADVAAFTDELGDALILPKSVAAAIVSDPLGEKLACAMRTLTMPSEAFQRVLLFLNPAIGNSVMDVYRLARLYDVLGERAALVMLAAWRGASIAQTRAKYRPALYDDERQRARAATPQARPSVQVGDAVTANNLRESSGR
jgi:hypothetical protein